MPDFVTTLGSVAALWRYPIKSMQGEAPRSVTITDRGLIGDRAYALIDTASGAVVSAKNPRKWPTMFGFRAGYAEAPRATGPLPAVRIAAPDGSQMATDQPGVDHWLSTMLGRAVHLAAAAPQGASLECCSLDPQDAAQTTDPYSVPLPPGTFFDLAAVHLVTTATLAELRRRNPQSDFAVARFRPNVVVQTPADGGFPENDWIGKTICLGAQVRLSVIAPCPRCIMTTLPQGDLPKDSGVLRAAVEHNQGNVGIYAIVVQGGETRLGDPLSIE
jgi:hypothetical protein